MPRIGPTQGEFALHSGQRSRAGEFSGPESFGTQSSYPQKNVEDVTNRPARSNPQHSPDPLNPRSCQFRITAPSKTERARGAGKLPIAHRCPLSRAFSAEAPSLGDSSTGVVRGDITTDAQQ